VINIFIPIKEHSQRVPNKNFRFFGEKKLYQYVISKYFDYDNIELYVDTDSEEIFNWINNDCPDNFHAYWRDTMLVGDDTSVNLLIENFVDTYCCDDNDLVIQTHVTSPFLNTDVICALDKWVFGTGRDSITSANVIKSRLWREEGYGYCPINHNPMKMEKTQDLPAIYEENSAFYAFTVGSFKRCKKRIGSNNCFYEINFPENLDIDTEDDWELCCKIRAMLNKD